jgi:hypothetical protein
MVRWTNLRSVGKGDTVRTGPGVEQLGNVDPDETSPGEAVRDDEEVDEDGHTDGGSRGGSSLGVRLVGVEDGSDHEKEGSHTQGTVTERTKSGPMLCAAIVLKACLPEEEVLLSSSTLDSKDHEKGGGDDLDQSVDS